VADIASELIKRHSKYAASELRVKLQTWSKINDHLMNNFESIASIDHFEIYFGLLKHCHTAQGVGAFGRSIPSFINLCDLINEKLNYFDNDRTRNYTELSGYVTVMVNYLDLCLYYLDDDVRSEMLLNNNGKIEEEKYDKIIKNFVSELVGKRLLRLYLNVPNDTAKNRTLKKEILDLVKEQDKMIENIYSIALRAHQIDNTICRTGFLNDFNCETPNIMWLFREILFDGERRYKSVRSPNNTNTLPNTYKFILEVMTEFKEFQEYLFNTSYGIYFIDNNNKFGSRIEKLEHDKFRYGQLLSELFKYD
jgi:hypothetical protein